MLKPIISSFGPNALLLKWPSVIDAKMHAEILLWESLIKTHFENDLIELVTTYAEMALYFAHPAPLKEVNTFIESIDVQNVLADKRKPTTWLIPVCYEPEFGLDISIVAEHNNI
ncbi:MAG: carboxyltransferase domain-containing protein, partial [Flavobacteriaceae bacterium]|nr:carboxyltransferase domain-containing protein [Flavobacteriaceae bacterium]